MSARRKGKPQQRRKIETAEPEQDFITCGDCQHEFKLCDITKFIQHKVNGCNKENVDPFEHNDSGEPPDADPEEAVAVGISSRRTSISAPIANRSTPELRQASGDKTSPRPSRELPSTTAPDGAKPTNNDTNCDDEDDVSNDEDDNDDAAEEARASSARRRHNEANVNTNANQGPRRLTCVSCELTVDSAWSLMQHAQTKHNICIYVDDRITSPTIPRVKREDLEPGEINHSKLRHDVGRDRDGSPVDAKPRNEQGHSPSVHSSRTPHKDVSSSDLLRHRSTSSLTPPRDMTSQRSTPRSTATTPPHPSAINMTDMLSPSAASSLMFRMPPPDRGQISPVASGLVGSPFGRHPSDFRLDFGMSPADPFQRMSAAAAGLGLPITSSSHGALDHALAGIASNPFDRHLRAGGPAPHPGPPVTPGSLAAESAQDFYSQRLRQLAGTNSPSQTSPEAILRKPQLTPPFSQQLQQQPSTSFSTTSPPTTTDPPTPGAETSTKQNTLPSGKLRSCEFCGKSFRFQSNLIVHRRSHTGEKPFTCPLCPHACSQASKLKRHMKTHRPGGLSSALPSSSGLPMSSSLSTSSEQSGGSGDVRRDAEDSELSDEEDEEAVMEEARRMGLILDEPESNTRPEDSLKRETSEEPGTPASREQQEEEKQKSRASLLTEVMETTGLNNIPQYSEAFSQALQESTVKNSNGHHMENRGTGESSNRSERSESSDTLLENGHDSDAQSLLSDSRKTTSSVASHDPEFERPMSTSKRLKLEHPDPMPHMAAPHIPPYPISMAEQMWRTWVPPTGLVPRELIHGMGVPLPHEHFLPQANLPPHRHENGLGESAFRMDIMSGKPSSNGSLGGLSRHSSSPHPGPAAPMRSRSRNDTCEFCGKIFKNCSNLTVHRRSHTGEKPYRCTLCSYACAQSSKLTRHMKTHGRRGKDVYHCKFCSMPFSVPSTLEKHMRKCVENHQNPHAMAAAFSAAAAAASSSSKTSSIASSETSLSSSPGGLPELSKSA